MLGDVRERERERGEVQQTAEQRQTNSKTSVPGLWEKQLTHKARKSKTIQIAPTYDPTSL